jgi:catechol 2,3-dioxygenase-like lactoylglutathione lyase family enzyme
MLRHARLVAFAATTDAPRAAAFYTTVLGLTLRYEDEFAISLDSAGVEVRLQKVERFDPQPFTTLGWQVVAITEVVERLLQHGVAPERYPWLDQDGMGVWHAPSGARVVWFRDPDGNLLSVAEYAGE